MLTLEEMKFWDSDASTLRDGGRLFGQRRHPFFFAGRASQRLGLYTFRSSSNKDSLEATRFPRGHSNVGQLCLLNISCAPGAHDCLGVDLEPDLTRCSLPGPRHKSSSTPNTSKMRFPLMGPARSWFKDSRRPISSYEACVFNSLNSHKPS